MVSIRYFTSFLTIVLSLNFSNLVGKASSALPLYKKVEQHTLTHIPYMDEEWPQESFYDYLNRCMEYQRKPQEFKRRRLAFKLIYALQERAPHEITNVLNDTTTWQDLCLFSGSRSACDCLIDKICRTSTHVGKAQLSCMLSNPSSSIKELEKRQRIIKELCENQTLFNQFDDALQALASAEPLMLSFWFHDPLEQSAQRHYVNIPGATTMNEMINTNDVALEVSTLWDHQLRLIHAATSAMAAVVLPAYVISTFAGYKPSPKFHNFAQDLCKGGTLLACLKYGFSLVKGRGDLRESASRGAMLGDGILYGFSIKGNCEWVRDNIYLDICLQEKLIEVANYIKKVEECVALLQQLPVLARSLSSVPALYHTLYELPKHLSELEQFFELIKSTTFTGSASFFSRKGRVLVAFKLMHKVKKELQPLIGFVGELDSYLSAAKLCKESAGKNATYCFVQWAKRDAPFIAMHDFWNPFVDQAKVVPNSLTLDGGQSRANMILTGPNAGGKSTVLKATALALILAQTFGIAPAKNMSITPFSTIATYLNITDDIASGNSLFKAEVLRAQALIEKVQNLKKNEFSFVAIDEMFSGTSPQEGQAAAYSVAKHLGMFKNNIAMIATHYPVLTKLAENTPNFSNFKVSVKVEPDGRITYPFKLESGISDQHVAIDILQAEGFNNQILTDARNLLLTKQ